ncbi:MAG: F0F1 ATP synthase subunit epsilon [Dehalococcoidia bacterium]|nr:MAG: F0F1 ATP synthase subunit epsilon [Dehalococcoidia bacterium]
MSPIRLDVVSAERLVFSDEVDMVLAPGTQGQLGILPHHAPLMTMLEPGELLIRKGNAETCLVVAGGFMEVRPDHVTVLAEAAEKAEEIDIARAEEARCRAVARLEKHAPDVDLGQAEAALRRSLARIRAAERLKTRRRQGG